MPALAMLSGYNWFPGHMARGMKDALRKVQKCHLVIEVHDARIPLTGRNEKLKFSKHKKILVLNKYDLTDPKGMKLYNENDDSVPVILTNCRGRNQISGNITALQKAIIKLTKDDDIKNGVKVMIVGMPNVGKSSLINALRRLSPGIGSPKAAPISSRPGYTKTVSTFIKISTDPLIKLLDTPGIMIPNIKDEEMALKLAAVGTLDHRFVGEVNIAAYILKTLNEQKLYQYIKKYNLEGPCHDTDELLHNVGQRIGALLKGGFVDEGRSATHFIKNFREGQFGRIMLDSISEVEN
ncbi:PREDICTED: mitochondrial ribosome-associated GTPase 1-like [Amphimedon queenslandica]|uniref:Mitochondrial GTPase 1 n=1 Tax=Amphimedon queenslandica TaxID=400682 RepID=A0A1X7TZH5_AMPQE|nr:PREDICTED: mitochondrial ribosome-associated GTPase 1-like [Amphimedon queenslandica]|eukprot:XP_003389472.1 PREDICTED: mitochondrial ribosome-associated GTPase 1-like [Amphimedon queenslandica]